MYSNLYPLNESTLFVIPAELTDRVNNFVYLPEQHSIHLLVEFIEICTDLFVIISDAAGCGSEGRRISADEYVMPDKR